MKKRNANKHIGSSLESFLREEGNYQETRIAAMKEVLAWQVQQAMNDAKLTKVQMAKRMATSRSSLDRLLDPANTAVTLDTLVKAAQAVGRDLRIELA
jgi:predicted XRE-type DNA-binding protein